MKEIIKGSVLLLASILLARFLLPANITPLVAVAVFMPFITNSRHLQVWLPVGILFVTDLVLGFYGNTMFFVYGSMIAIGILSRYTHRSTYTGLIKTSLMSVLLWHLVVNFGVYINNLGAVSLINTYALAIPFDFRLLVSTLAFSSLFYGANYLVNQYLHKQDSGSTPTTFA